MVAPTVKILVAACDSPLLTIQGVVQSVQVTVHRLKVHPPMHQFVQARKSIPQDCRHYACFHEELMILILSLKKFAWLPGRPYRLGGVLF